MASGVLGSDGDALSSSQISGLSRSGEKLQAVSEACKWRNLDQLRALAESKGGFLSDELRQQAWPILLGINPEGLNEDLDASWKELPKHRDEDQVQLDVDRSFVYYPQDRTESHLSANKHALSALILEVLRTYPYLCYFQGYHDICQVLLLVLPPSLRTRAVARLSILRIRDFMLPRLDPAIAQLRLIPDILRAADPSLWRHLRGTEPFFALSGTLTMYAHDITTLGEISRLFDVLLAREPVFSVYMFATIVVSRREELFDTPEDEPEMLHSILSKLPKPLDLDRLIADAVALTDRYPPETLPAWRTISAASVLKTARDIDVCAKQTLEEGEAFFERQNREIVWNQRLKVARHLLWKYRRPVRTLGLAVLVGVVAVLLRRSPGPVRYLSALLARWTR
ncbi:GTPase-activating protein gyp10 [Coniochaeta ligniaria NRRL 30616]|uniref:GTPase-activating protein gyp10 n=1 Tax=Coniochaeta ligniaria NRRL 30616 TaxID=1408157 RepID=A0A1J7IY92_9PEZI|nr:GTPase-activating protein gyp10 [Coniochaeta ligniaria NRRL 30616]